MKYSPKNTIFFESYEPNKHWSKRLRFGEEHSQKILPPASCRPLTTQTSTARRFTLARIAMPRLLYIQTVQIEALPVGPLEIEDTSDWHAFRAISRRQP